MTAQTVAQPTASPWLPKKNVGDLVRVFNGDVDPDVAAEFQAALEAAGSEAECCRCYDPFAGLVEAWWPQAVFWADPVKARELLARAERYRREGPPPPERRTSREQAIAGWEARHGRRLSV